MTPTRSGAAIGQALPQLGKTWFFITADYVFGRALQAGATAFIEKNGGKVVGGVRVPLGTTRLLFLHAAGAGIEGGCRCAGERRRRRYQFGQERA